MGQVMAGDSLCIVPPLMAFRGAHSNLWPLMVACEDLAVHSVGLELYPQETLQDLLSHLWVTTSAGASASAIHLEGRHRCLCYCLVLRCHGSVWTETVVTDCATAPALHAAIRWHFHWSWHAAVGPHWCAASVPYDRHRQGHQQPRSARGVEPGWVTP